MSVLKHGVVVFISLVAYCYIYNYISTKGLPPPRVSGYFHPSFRKVAETFRENLNSGFEQGASFSVVQNGKVLVDLYGGWADIDAHRHWQEDTMSLSWSMTKGVTALLVGMLVDKGILDYKKPVYHYWPDFGAEGKKNVTVEMLLSHQAGLIILDEQVALLDYKNNWPKVEKILARQKPRWPPGTAVGYHVNTWGMYVDALVRRADPKHRNVSEIFRQEIAEPFGIDFHIGLPPHLFHRYTRMREFSVLEMRMNVFETLPVMMGPLVWPAARSIDYSIKSERLMDPTNVQVGVPSAVGVGGAKALAKLYDFMANDGIVGGKRLLSSSTVQLLHEPLTQNLEKILLANYPFSRGLFIKKKQGRELVGHSGYGGSYAGADMTIGVGMAYSTNHLALYLSDDPRFLSLQEAFYEGYDDYIKKGLKNEV